MLLAWIWALFSVQIMRWPLPPLMAKPVPKQFWTLPLQAPRLVPWLLPYREWEQEYREYFQRHYRDPRVRFRPTMIVMHYTVTDDAEAVWEGFARGGRMDAGDYGMIFGHVSVQLMVDKDGTVYQLLPLDWRCTGAYGVNHVALSIEMIAANEKDLLSRPRQVWSSICLVRYLMRRFDIPLSKVVSHNDVSIGRLVLPEYLDYADSKWPYGYPPQFFRYDPGMTYMAWLKTVLRWRK